MAGNGFIIKADKLGAESFCMFSCQNYFKLKHFVPQEIPYLLENSINSSFYKTKKKMVYEIMHFPPSKCGDNKNHSNKM